MSENESYLCDAHEWAINTDNSGECMRCGIKVGRVAEAKTAKRCTPHYAKQGSGWHKLKEVNQ